MSAIRMPLRRMLAKLSCPTFTLTEDSIRQARCRARKTGKSDPYPWVLNRAVGRPVPLADLPGYNEVARREGWPLWPMSVDYLSGGGTA